MPFPNLVPLLHAYNANKAAHIDELRSAIDAMYSRNVAFFNGLNAKLSSSLSSPPISYQLLLDECGLNIINTTTGATFYAIEEGESTMISTALNVSKSPLQNPLWQLNTNDELIHHYDEDRLGITAKSCNKIFSFISGTAMHFPSHFLPQTSIFGLGGGLFLQMLLEAGYYFHSLLVFEEDLDFFKLSCFFLDYSRLFDATSPSSCYLFISNLFSKDLVSTHFANKKITNNFISLSLKFQNSEKINSAISIVQEAYLANSRGWGSFEDELIGLKNALSNMQNYKILDDFKRVNAPFMVVGSGSSLDDLLPFISANADNLIIISCGTALKVLQDYGITPDFQIEIERTDYLDNVLKEANLKSSTTLLCASVVDPKVAALSEDTLVFIRGGSSSSYLGLAPCVDFSAPFVGVAGIAIASLLGSDVLIAGVDCGYIEGRYKHAKGSYYGSESATIPPDGYEIRGNKSLKVYATPLFSLALANISLAISTYRPPVVLNLGSGAYISGAISVDTSEFTLAPIDKPSILQAIKSKFHVHNNFDFEKFSDEVGEFLEDIKSILLPAPTSKGALFTRIDDISSSLDALVHRYKSPALVFDGSIKHLLQCTMIACLFANDDEVLAIYSRCIDEIFTSLSKMQMSLKLALWNIAPAK